MKATLFLDEQSVSAMRDMPQRMSASKITRWLLKTATCDDKQLEKLLKTDKEYREVQDYLRPRLMELFDIDDEQRKKFVKRVKKIGL